MKPYSVDGLSSNGRIMAGMFILIRHCFVFRGVYGEFPTCWYLMRVFDYDIDVVSAVLERAEWIANRKQVQS